MKGWQKKSRLSSSPNLFLQSLLHGAVSAEQPGRGAEAADAGEVTVSSAAPVSPVCCKVIAAASLALGASSGFTSCATVLGKLFHLCALEACEGAAGG